MGILRIKDNNNNNDIIKYDDSFLNEIIQSLNLKDAHKEEKAIHLYKKNVNKISNSLKKNDNILINGEVQSGKTNNLLFLVDSLVNGQKRDVVIYLTGRLNSINDQNHGRFYDIFSKFDDKYLVVKTKNPKRISQDYVNKVNEGKVLILNMLKLPEKLESLINFLKMNNFSFILINDEGDDATLTDSGKKMMDNLYNLEVEKKVITITASPYENLAFQKFDDYIILESSEYYNGIDKFNYINSSGIEKPQIIFNAIEDWISTNAKKEGKQILINTSLHKEEHEEIFKLVKTILSILKDRTTVEDELNLIKDIILNERIYITNSENHLDTDRNNHIIIGGHNLSRGVTFSGLTHEVLFSEVSSIKAATLIQRARWCGYRGDPKQLKIYLSENLYNGFIELMTLQKETFAYDIKSNNYERMFEELNFKQIKLRG